MGNQIIFFEKNKADYSFQQVVATASEGSDIAKYALNRSNATGWITTDSLDANNTTFEVDLVDLKSVTDLLLVKHNFKSFTLQWYDGMNWNDFTPAINVTDCTDDVSWFQFQAVMAQKFKLTITGTQIPNSDKYLYQFIVTEKIGQFEGWPVIKDPEHSRNLVITSTLSGKKHVSENVGGFSFTLSVTEWKSDNDLTLLETLHQRSEGFLTWLCGGSQVQFSSVRKGYRLEDLPLMKCVTPWKPEFVKGMYQRGMAISTKFAEVIE